MTCHFSFRGTGYQGYPEVFVGVGALRPTPAEGVLVGRGLLTPTKNNTVVAWAFLPTTSQLIATYNFYYRILVVGVRTLRPTAKWCYLEVP